MNKQKAAALGLSFMFVVVSATAIAATTAIAAGSILIGSSCGLADWVGPGCIDRLGGAVSDDGIDTFKQDFRNDAAFTTDSRQDNMKLTRSHLNQTFGMGMTKAKIAVVEALNNDKSQATAQSKALSEVNDFYSKQQLRVIVKRNREVLKANTTLNQAQDLDGLTIDDVLNANDVQFSQNSDGTIEDFRIGNTTTELYNSTKAEVLTLEFKYNDGFQSVWGYQYGPEVGKATDMGYRSDTKLHLSIGDNPLWLNTDPYNKTLDRLNSNYERATDNVVGLADDVYSKWQPDDLSVSGILGPLEALQQASTNYEDTGYYSYRALSLEQAGYASNDSYAFNVTWQNTDMSDPQTDIGQLFVANESQFGGELETGVEYSASDKSVWFVRSNGDQKAVETDLNGTFTINEMTDTETGEEVNTTSVQSTELYTPQIQDLQKQLEEIREDQEKLFSGGIISGAADSLSGFLNDIGLGWVSDSTRQIIVVIAAFMSIIAVLGVA